MIKEYQFDQQATGQILEDKAKTHGEKVFLRYEGKKEITFGEFNEITNRIANGFIRLGLSKGDKIATFLPNCLEDAYLWFGAAKVGIIDVPINLANRGDFLLHIINTSDARLLIIDQQLIDRLKFIENDVLKLEKVVIFSNSSPPKDIPKLRFEVINYEELINSPSENVHADVKGSDVQMIIYTSGTTGPAKGVMQSHSMLYISALEYLKAIRARPDDVFFTCLPLFHANARILCLYAAILMGTKAVIRERFSASKFWDWTRESGATVFNSLGAMANFIYNQPRKNNDADNPIRICAAFPMPAPIFADFEKRYNLKVIEGYGLTEVAIITYNPYDAPKIGSCGKETANLEVRIVDDNDFPVPPGTVGEIVARGKIPWATSSGYYNMPEKTVELVRNHYYHSGDLGYLNEDGYLYFVDRKKDYIRRRGENISSFEVERTINAHPKVDESAAISVRSELSEDEVKIVVVLKKEESLAPEELLDFCQERMPYFAVPRYIEFVEGLPKTPTDRVRKNLLRESGVNINTWDREKAGYKVTR